MKKMTRTVLCQIVFWASLGVLLSTGCKNEQQDSLVSHVPRGISGLELGMSPEQVGQVFAIKEDTDPVALLVNKYGAPEAGETVSMQNRALQKRYFRISSGVGKLPDGVTSADIRATHNTVYVIGFHYDELSAKNIGWKGVTYPYLAKYGKPVKDTGSGYIWDDGRTRLDIESSGPTINVFFTDQALETEVKKSEREYR